MAKKRNNPITFSEQGMRSFSHLADAFDYFTKPENGKHSHKSITDLFHQTYLVKIGTVCVNFAQHAKDEKGFNNTMRAIFKTKESHESFLNFFTEWKNKFNEKEIELDPKPSDESNFQSEAEISGE